MSDLQRAWAKSKLSLPSGDLTLKELQEEEEKEEEELEADDVSELPEHIDDDSSSASSMSSTGTIIPSPTQKLFARPQG
jgi:protein phosphatase methylesterase 1